MRGSLDDDDPFAGILNKKSKRKGGASTAGSAPPKPKPVRLSHSPEFFAVWDRLGFKAPTTSDDCPALHLDLLAKREWLKTAPPKRRSSSSKMVAKVAEAEAEAEAQVVAEVQAQVEAAQTEVEGAQADATQADDAAAKLRLAKMPPRGEEQPALDDPGLCRKVGDESQHTNGMIQITALSDSRVAVRLGFCGARL